MKNNYQALVEFMEKAIYISQKSLTYADQNDFLKLDKLIVEREKVVNIILTLHERLDLEQNNLPTEEDRRKAIQFNNQANLLFSKIAELDQKLIDKLDIEKNKTQIEIAKSFKNKENLKGYNLNCLK